MASVFPGKTAQGILDELAGINENNIFTLATAVFVGVPQYAAGFLAELIGIDEERLLNDENVGLKGFLEIIKAFTEVNELGEAAALGAGLIKRIKPILKPAIPNIGSNP